MAQGRIADRVAIVTGGASGIGKATAERFTAEGAKVVIGDLEQSQGAKVAEKIGGVFVATDVRESKSVENLVARAIERFKRLDIMFNNAGICVPEPIVGATEDNYLNTINIDLSGVYWGLKYAGKVMVEQKGGTIVNTASVAGLVGNPMLSAYNAAKHGVVGLTRSAALEFAPAGVRVNCVCPGVVDTPLLGPALQQFEGMRRDLAKVHPLGRIADAREIASAVLFLVSDDASFITGHALVVDGGFMAGRGFTQDT